MSDKADRQPKACSDCGGAMTEGLVPDGLNGIVVVQPKWVEGKLGGNWLTGARMPKGSPCPVKAWRCEDCGVLKFYAHKKQWRHVTD